VVLPQPSTRPKQHTGRVAEASSQPGQQASLDTGEQCEQHVTDLAVQLALPAAGATMPAPSAEPRRSSTGCGCSSLQDHLHLAQRGVLVGAGVLRKHPVRHSAARTDHPQYAALLAAKVSCLPGVVPKNSSALGKRACQRRTPKNLLGVVAGCRGGDSERGSGPTRRSGLFRPRTTGSSGGPDTLLRLLGEGIPGHQGAPSSLASLPAGGAVGYRAAFPLFDVGGSARGRQSPVR